MNSTDKFIDEMATPLRARLDQVEAEINTLNEKLATLRTQKKKISSILTVISPTVTEKSITPSAKTKKKGKTNEWTVSDEMATRVEKALVEFDGPFTIGEISEKVGISTTTGRKALETLRKREVVRLAGQNGTRGNAILYAPMNNS